jgi:hypothetical protein
MTKERPKEAHDGTSQTQQELGVLKDLWASGKKANAWLKTTRRTGLRREFFACFGSVRGRASEQSTSRRHTVFHLPS